MRAGEMRESNQFLCDRPLAAPGLTSYRCRGGYGWIMIGAKDPNDAMREAARSSDKARRDTLQVWNGERYVPCPTTRP